VELASDNKRVGTHVAILKKSIDTTAAAHLTILEAHMQNTAENLKIKPVKIAYTDIEKKAAKIFPKQTAQVKADGYRGYFEYISNVSAEDKKKYPYKAMNIGNSRELQLLINGKNSVLDIKFMLDAQGRRLTKLEDILNYIEILKIAGLVEL